MSRHSEVCDWLRKFAERHSDPCLSLGSWAGDIQSKILRHPESQPKPNDEIRRLRAVLQQIASAPERYRKPSGEEVGPEWQIYDIKQMAMEALMYVGESQPQ